MPISTLDNVLLLVQRVGDIDPETCDPISPFRPGKTGIVMQNADRLYQKYFDRLSIQPAALGQQIFDHYFMLDGLQIVIGILEARVDFAAVGTAMRVSLSQRAKTKLAMVDRLNAKLLLLEDRATASSAPAVGDITKIVPIDPPLPGQLEGPSNNPFVVDANAPSLSGSPYWPAWRRW